MAYILEIRVYVTAFYNNCKKLVVLAEKSFGGSDGRDCCLGFSQVEAVWETSKGKQQFKKEKFSWRKSRCGESELSFLVI